MGFEMRKKKRFKKAKEFTKRIKEVYKKAKVSQTSFGHISTISSTIPTVSKPA